MATKKPAAKSAPTKKPAAKKVAKVAAKKAQPAELKPIKQALTKAGLIEHLSKMTELEPKNIKKVLAALEATALASVSKKGLGAFTLPGLIKIVATKVPAKAKRFGKNPFTGQEQWFPAKPASIRIKVRPLKKVKDAAA